MKITYVTPIKGELTDEEFEILKKYDEQIRTASESNFAKDIQTKDIDTIADIYSRLIGQQYKYNKNCSKCRLKLLQKISTYYLNKLNNGTERKEDNGPYREERKTESLLQEQWISGQSTEDQRNSKGTGKRKNKNPDSELVS